MKRSIRNFRHHPMTFVTGLSGLVLGALMLAGRTARYSSKHGMVIDYGDHAWVFGLILAICGLWALATAALPPSEERK